MSKRQPIGTLHLVVVECDNLPARDLDGLADPYATVEVQSPVLKEHDAKTFAEKTTVQTDTLSPRFNAAFALPVYSPFDCVGVRIFNHNRWTVDDCLGQLDVLVARLRPGEEEQTWFVLGPKRRDNAFRVAHEARAFVEAADKREHMEDEVIEEVDAERSPTPSHSRPEQLTLAQRRESKHGFVRLRMELEVDPGHLTRFRRAHRRLQSLRIAPLIRVELESHQPTLAPVISGSETEPSSSNEEPASKTVTKSPRGILNAAFRDLPEALDQQDQDSRQQLVLRKKPKRKKPKSRKPKKPVEVEEVEEEEEDDEEDDDDEHHYHAAFKQLETQFSALRQLYTTKSDKLDRLRKAYRALDARYKAAHKELETLRRKHLDQVQVTQRMRESVASSIRSSGNAGSRQRQLAQLQMLQVDRLELSQENVELKRRIEALEAKNKEKDRKLQSLEQELIVCRVPKHVAELQSEYGLPADAFVVREFSFGGGGVMVLFVEHLCWKTSPPLWDLSSSAEEERDCVSLHNIVAIVARAGHLLSSSVMHINLSSGQIHKFESVEDVADCAQAIADQIERVGGTVQLTLPRVRS